MEALLRRRKFKQGLVHPSLRHHPEPTTKAEF